MDNIIKELNLNWQDHHEVMAELDKEIRMSYGLGVEEYLDIRNNLLREHNGVLPYEVLSAVMLNKMLIDLTGRGYLSVGFNPNAGLELSITDKGRMSIVQAMHDGDLAHNEDDPLQAIVYLRNRRLLRD